MVLHVFSSYKWYKIQVQALVHLVLILGSNSCSPSVHTLRTVGISNFLKHQLSFMTSEPRHLHWIQQCAAQNLTKSLPLTINFFRYHEKQSWQLSWRQMEQPDIACSVRHVPNLWWHQQDLSWTVISRITHMKHRTYIGYNSLTE